MGVKSIDQAAALPEIEFEPMEGPIVGAGIAGDDIILFVDRDGRVMKVVETPDGLRKTEFRF